MSNHMPICRTNYEAAVASVAAGAAALRSTVGLCMLSVQYQLSNAANTTESIMIRQTVYIPDVGMSAQILLSLPRPSSTPFQSLRRPSITELFVTTVQNSLQITTVPHV